MKMRLKLRRSLAADIRRDLARPHPVVAERVGFMSCRAANVSEGNLLLVAEGYFPVDDADYLPSEYGVKIGPGAFRAAMQVALSKNTSMIHVHMHDHRGQPGFSKIDVSEYRRFIPDFFNAAPGVPHGALVLSHDHAIAAGMVSRDSALEYFDEVTEIGMPFKFSWRWP